MVKGSPFMCGGMCLHPGTQELEAGGLGVQIIHIVSLKLAWTIELLVSKRERKKKINLSLSDVSWGTELACTKNHRSLVSQWVIHLVVNMLEPKII